jgi:hypothetical protein
MQSNLYPVADLAQGDRAVVERLVGHSLTENEVIFIGTRQSGGE